MRTTGTTKAVVRVGHAALLLLGCSLTLSAQGPASTQIRFDHSWDRPGYNNGTARNQFFVGADLIYEF